MRRLKYLAVVVIATTAVTMAMAGSMMVELAKTAFEKMVTRT
jgi:hypothetical protein